jgi:hypothetical protein
LKHQIAHIITADDVKNLQHEDFTVGGDHGKGRFRMTFKMLLRYSDKQSVSKLFQIASVEYSKDDIVILNSTVLKPFGEGLKEVKDGGRFIVIAGQDTLSFAFKDEDHSKNAICNVPIRIFMAGDLKFYAQMLGRNNMSCSWCIWCQLAPNEWKILCNERCAAVKRYEAPWSIRASGSSWSRSLSNLGFY